MLVSMQSVPKPGVLALGAGIIVVVVLSLSRAVGSLPSSAESTATARPVVIATHAQPAATLHVVVATPTLRPVREPTQIVVGPPTVVAAPGSCRFRGPLPDSLCTPGAVLSTDTAVVCKSGYSHSVRNVPQSEKQAVYAAYGIRQHVAGQYEVDHLIPLELGGSNAQSNLWPEPALPAPGFHQKDAVENELHTAVCSGKMALFQAQGSIASNWLSWLVGP